jgi:PIN domain nuclease of toxin-antitoxin system
VNFLIDSHLFWWCQCSPELLPSRARDLIQDPGSVIYISAATIWELGIRLALGRLRPSVPLETLVPTIDFEQLPVTSRHALAAARLPYHHSDPFDRMLVAQALVERLTLLTTDQDLPKYGDFVQLV